MEALANLYNKSSKYKKILLNQEGSLALIGLNLMIHEGNGHVN